MRAFGKGEGAGELSARRAARSYVQKFKLEVLIPEAQLEAVLDLLAGVNAERTLGKVRVWVSQVLPQKKLGGEQG